MNAQQIAQVEAVTSLYRTINRAFLIGADKEADARSVTQFIDDFQHLVKAPCDDVSEVNRRYAATLASARLLTQLIDADRVQLIASYQGGVA